MPASVTRKTPGVYVVEQEAFPPSVVGVPTAIPAFIGYTQTAAISGKPVYQEPIKIGALVDYESIFGTGYKPLYNIEEVTDEVAIKNGKYDFRVFDGENKKFLYYNLAQANNARFNLYDSIRLFYANGGGTCYVVSVGDYASGESKIDLAALKSGLAVIAEQVGPTMLVIPDAVLLPNTGDEEKKWISSEFADLVKGMIEQAGTLQDRVAILDIYGSQWATKENLEDIITQFRTDVGDEYLSYGLAYFPFLDATVVQVDEFNYQNVTNLDVLKTILTLENNNLYDGVQKLAVQADIDSTSIGNTPEEAKKLSQNLTNALPLLLDIERCMVAQNNVLPPSGALAGVYTYTDTTKGVWNAPANIALGSVDKATFKLNDAQQGDLNVPVDGKAIDAIRDFTGRGTVVWGARTLDGNSNDFRYIQVRRTLIYLEQSIKLALNPFVFGANDGNTWSTVVSMISSFLQGVWSQGGLMGAKASDAYTVQCGLGTTMTAQDVLDGYMIVQVTLQMIRPAEFIELNFKQKMEGLG